MEKCIKPFFNSEEQDRTLEDQYLWILLKTIIMKSLSILLKEPIDFIRSGLLKELVLLSNSPVLGEYLNCYNLELKALRLQERYLDGYSKQKPVSKLSLRQTRKSSFSENAYQVEVLPYNILRKLPFPFPYKLLSDNNNKVSFDEENNRTCSCLCKSGETVVLRSVAIPTAIPAFYYEIKIIEEGRKQNEGISIGLLPISDQNVSMPGIQSGYGYFSINGKKSNYKNGLDEYGPPFGKGDVVGCCWVKSDGKLFFTKNGNALGTAYKNIIGQFCVGIGLAEFGARITVNFGQEPFRYDFSKMVVDLLNKENPRNSSSNSPAPPRMVSPNTSKKITEIPYGLNSTSPLLKSSIMDDNFEKNWEKLEEDSGEIRINIMDFQKRLLERKNMIKIAPLVKKEEIDLELSGESSEEDNWFKEASSVEESIEENFSENSNFIFKHRQQPNRTTQNIENIKIGMCYTIETTKFKDWPSDIKPSLDKYGVILNLDKQKNEVLVAHIFNEQSIVISSWYHVNSLKMSSSDFTEYSKSGDALLEQLNDIYKVLANIYYAKKAALTLLSNWPSSIPLSISSLGGLEQFIKILELVASSEIMDKSEQVSVMKVLKLQIEQSLKNGKYIEEFSETSYSYLKKSEKSKFNCGFIVDHEGVKLDLENLNSQKETNNPQTFVEISIFILQVLLEQSPEEVKKQYQFIYNKILGYIVESSFRKKSLVSFLIDLINKFGLPRNERKKELSMISDYLEKKLSNENKINSKNMINRLIELDLAIKHKKEKISQSQQDERSSSIGILKKIEIINDTLESFVNHNIPPVPILWKTWAEFFSKKVITIESSHPYKEKEEKKEINIPNAKEILVKFSKKCAIDSNAIIYFSKHEDGSEILGKFKNEISGNQVCISNQQCLFFQFQPKLTGVGIFHEIECYYCNKNPASDILFHCTNCDFILCSVCEEKLVHNEEHAFLVLKRNLPHKQKKLLRKLPLLYQHSDSPLDSFTCRECNKKCDVTRYKCSNCVEDYSICSDCFLLDKHDQSHVFLKCKKNLLPNADYLIPVLYPLEEYWGYKCTIIPVLEEEFIMSLILQNGEKLTNIVREQKKIELERDLKLVSKIDQFCELKSINDPSTLRIKHSKLNSLLQFLDDSFDFHLRAINIVDLNIQLLYIFKYVDLSLKNFQWSIAKKISDLLHLVLLPTKNQILQSFFNRTSYRGLPQKISLDRHKAVQERNSKQNQNQNNHILENSIFMQTYNQVCELDPSTLRSSEQPWTVHFLGESGIDYGGKKKKNLSFLILIIIIFFFKFRCF